MESHLIIGIGRIGERVLCEMRKRVYEVFADNRQTHILLDYLSVTFDDNELNESEWNCWGEDVRLAPFQKMKVHKIRGYEKLFVDEFRNRIAEHINKLSKNSGPSELTIHVFVDVERNDKNILRKLYEWGKTLNIRIISYFYIPEKGNDYIVLGGIYDLFSEFSGLQAYSFSSNCDATGDFLKGDTISVEMAEYLFLYIYEKSHWPFWLQRIVYRDVITFIPEKRTAGEDIPCSFMALGMKRMTYPNNEIKWYAEQKALYAQLLGLVYNQWESEKGYVKSFVDDEYIKIQIRKSIHQPHVLDRLCLSLDYLTLQRPIPNYHHGYENWDTYDNYWQQHGDFFMHYIKEGDTPYENWLLIFDEKMAYEYNSHFREMGVVDYFNEKSFHVHSIAKHICNHIERVLFDDWTSDCTIEGIPMSLHSMMLYVEAIRNIIQCQIDNSYQTKEMLSQEIVEYQTDANKIKEEYDSWGFLRRAISGEKIFAYYVRTMSLFYTLSTKITALDFAILLQQSIVNHLNSLHEKISLSVNDYNELLTRSVNVLEKFERTDTIIDRNRSQVVEECCDWNEIRYKIEKGVLSNEHLQKEIQTNLLIRIKEEVDKIGGSSLFENIYSVLDTILFDELFHPILQDELIDLGLIGRNVLEGILSQCKTDEEIRHFISKVVKGIQCLIQFGQSEVRYIVTGGKELENIHSIKIISIPDYNEKSHCINRFMQIFSEMYENKVEIVKTYSCDEIVVTKIKTNIF